MKHIRVLKQLYRIIKFTRFKWHNSMIFSNFTSWGNYHHKSMLNCFIPFPPIISITDFNSASFGIILEKAMAPHSSTLAWKIPWTEEPGRLQSMGSHRVGHNWATSLSLFTFMHWRRKWHPTPVFLPGESQGWGSLVGCHPWGHTESDMTGAI